jgi:hypothetical protein
MPQVRASKSPNGEVCVGLRILAKIIARELVHQQSGKMSGLGTDPTSLDPVPAQVSYSKGVIHR